MLSSLDAAAQLAGPNLQILQLLLLHEPGQGSRELQQGGNRKLIVYAVKSLVILFTLKGSVCDCLYLFPPC